jgi:non-lysosomal glucosylceramidase
VRIIIPSMRRVLTAGCFAALATLPCIGLNFGIAGDLAQAEPAPQHSSLPRPTRTDHCEFVGGVPLGGIGTGTFEVRGDGSFREWQIFNNWGNAETLGGHGEGPSYDLLNAFAAIKVDGKACMLETHPPRHLPGIASISYDGWFPFARLKYELGDAAPVKVSMEAFGSFVPHHPEESGIPAAGFTWRLKNTSDKAVQVSLALSVVNPLGQECREESSGSMRIAESTQGRSGLAVAALDAQAISLTGGPDNADALKAFWEQFSGSDSKFSNTETGQRIAQVITFSIQPGEEKSERFVVGWFFPDHQEDGAGPLVGHQYESWANSPVDSVHLLADRFEALRAASAKWCDNLQDSSWPSWVNHWLCNSQYTLDKFSWWTRDGRFMKYESPGCPNGSPAHIIDLADWPVLDSFPELELGLLRGFAGIQQKNGRIPEEFNYKNGPSITTPGGRDLIDISPKYVVEVYHRWRETADRKFLNDSWPSVKKAILYARKFDAMHIGLPSGPDLSSTWDHWNDRYCFSYGGSVWLAGVRAAEELAKIEGDTAFATEMHAMDERGVAAMNRILWNGEFYAMTTDKDLKQDDLCFVESTYGDVFARLVGLGGVLPDDKALATLRAIAKYNNQPTKWGLVVSATMSGQMVEYDHDRRAQITVCHAIPAPIGLIQLGNDSDVENGLRILRQIYDLGAKHPGGLWNLPHHVVAATGERNVDDFPHYMRDRAIWALMKVLNGWSYDAADRSLEVGPLLNPEKCHGPWSCSKGYGTLSQEINGKRQTVSLTSKDGSLELKELAILVRTGTVGSVTATVDGKAVETQFTQKENRVQLSFAMPVTLASGSTIEVVLEGDKPFQSTVSGGSGQ